MYKCLDEQLLQLRVSLQHSSCILRCLEVAEECKDVLRHLCIVVEFGVDLLQRLTALSFLLLLFLLLSFVASVVAQISTLLQF